MPAVAMATATLLFLVILFMGMLLLGDVRDTSGGAECPTVQTLCGLGSTESGSPMGMTFSGLRGARLHLRVLVSCAREHRERYSKRGPRVRGIGSLEGAGATLRPVSDTTMPGRPWHAEHRLSTQVATRWGARNRPSGWDLRRQILSVA